MDEEITKRFLINIEDLKKYFNNRKIINKEEYIKYLLEKEKTKVIKK